MTKQATTQHAPKAQLPELIVALDMSDKAAALALAQSLQGKVPWLKVGLELFSYTGPSIVQELKTLGFSVFLDLKLHDIPNTVCGAARAAAHSGADMLTIHLCGGEAMAKAALQGAQEAQAQDQQRLRIFGVTVLTSTAAEKISGGVGSLVHERAGQAQYWGLDGVVCSGHEVAGIKKAYPNLFCLCPGIRPAGAATHDQQRVMTPQQAVAAGAEYLVVGRPITCALSPAQAAQEIIHAMQEK